MPSVGETLRLARVDQGLDLTEVSARTKIGVRFLEAIEADQRDVLPGGFFYRNWVQQYARSLHLDLDSITSEVDRILIADQPPPLPGQEHSANQFLQSPRMTIEQPDQGGNRLLVSFALLVAVILGCSGFYSLWHKMTTAPVQETVAVSPSAPAKAELTPQKPSVPVSEPSAQSPATDPAAAQPAPAREATTAQPVSEPEVIGTPDGSVLIEIAATAQTWLSISPDGKQLFSGILRPAEVKRVAARDGARIRVGNAGGLEVRLNGKSIGPIGLPGQVRTVIINKDGFQILESKPASPTASTFNSSNSAAVSTPFD